MSLLKIIGKKGENELPIKKLITLILVALVVVALIFAMVFLGIPDVIKNLPGFKVNDTIEQVDLRDCPVIIGRLQDEKIIFCNSNFWEKNAEGTPIGCDLNKINPTSTYYLSYQNFESMPTPMYLDFKDQKIKLSIGLVNDFFSDELSIGSFVLDNFNIYDSVLEGRGFENVKLMELYKFNYMIDSESDLLYYLKNLDGAFLFGKSYICRKEKIDPETYKKDMVSFKYNNKNYYYDIYNLIKNNINGKGIIKLFLDKEETLESKSFIDEKFNVVYLEELSLEEIDALNGDYSKYKKLLFERNFIENVISKFKENTWVSEEGELGFIGSADNYQFSQIGGYPYVRLTSIKRTITHPISGVVTPITPWIRAEYFILKGKEAFLNIESRPELCDGSYCAIEE